MSQGRPILRFMSEPSADDYRIDRFEGGTGASGPSGADIRARPDSGPSGQKSAPEPSSPPSPTLPSLLQPKRGFGIVCWWRADPGFHVLRDGPPSVPHLPGGSDLPINSDVRNVSPPERQVVNEKAIRICSSAEDDRPRSGCRRRNRCLWR